MTNNGWLASVYVSTLDNGGSDTIDVADDTAATPPAAGELRLVAPLRWTETCDDQLWPAQPREFWSVQVFANTASELAGVSRNHVMAIGFIMDRDGTVFPPFGDVPFDILATGVVQEVSMRPHDQGMVATITGVDFRVGYLSNDYAGTVDYPSEPVTDRLTTLLGAPVFDWVSPGFGTDPNLAARTASRTTLLELVDRTLASWVEIDGGGVPIERAVLSVITNNTPYTTDGHSLDRWKVVGQPKAMDAADAITIQAAYVDFSAEWTKRVNGMPTRVTVEYPSGGGPALVTTSATVPGATLITTRGISSDVTSPVVAGRIADLYLPEAGATDWYADTFRYWLGRDPQAKPPVPRVGNVVTIEGIPADDHPLGGTSWQGQVVVSDLTVDGEPYVDITLRPAAAPSVLDGGDAATAPTSTIDGGPAIDTQTDTIDGGAAA